MADEGESVIRGTLEYGNGLDGIAAKLQELETLRARNLDLEKGIHLATMTIEALESQLSAERSNVAGAQAERDQAIAERAIFEALFASFRAQLEAFEVPAAILSPRTARALASGGVLGKDLPHTARWLGGAPSEERAELEETKATVAEVKLPDAVAAELDPLNHELEPPLEQFIPPKHRKGDNRGVKHDSA